MTIEDRIKNNMGLAISIVKSFKPRNRLEFDEFIQQARLGLWRAAKKFEREPNVGAFSTIATNSIVWEILALIKQRKRHPHITLMEGSYSISEKFWEFIPNTLTDQERKIITLMVQGYKRNQIYKSMNISQAKFTNLLKSASRKIRRANNEKNLVHI